MGWTTVRPLSEWGDRDPGDAVWGGFITHTFLEVYEVLSVSCTGDQEWSGTDTR